MLHQYMKHKHSIRRRLHCRRRQGNPSLRGESTRVSAWHRTFNDEEIVRARNRHQPCMNTLATDSTPLVSESLFKLAAPLQRHARARKRGSMNIKRPKKFNRAVSYRALVISPPPHSRQSSIIPAEKALILRRRHVALHETHHQPYITITGGTQDAISKRVRNFINVRNSDF